MKYTKNYDEKVKIMSFSIDFWLNLMNFWSNSKFGLEIHVQICIVMTILILSDAWFGLKMSIKRRFESDSKQNLAQSRLYRMSLLWDNSTNLESARTNPRLSHNLAIDWISAKIKKYTDVSEYKIVL